jgi:hypothetical protein
MEIKNLQLETGSEKGLVSKETNEGRVARNYFRVLLPDAMEEMRRIMKTSDNEKLVAQVAKDVIELAGEGVQRDMAPMVMINDSDVRLLLNVTKEVFSGAR